MRARKLRPGMRLRWGLWTPPICETIESVTGGVVSVVRDGGGRYHATVWHILKCLRDGDVALK